MAETNKIAILLASCNGEKYIAQQLDSILAQSNTEWELFIHDDGSTDCTPKIVKEYEKRDPSRIHILSSAPCGNAKDNFFSIMRQVHAPYVMFCDQDDFWLPKKVELTLQLMKELEQEEENLPALVFTDLSVVDRDLNFIAERMSNYQRLDPKRTAAKDLMIQNIITGCTVMINSSLAELALQAEDTDSIIMHDWWCALIAAFFGKIGFVDIPLVLYRQHEKNTLGAKNIRNFSYICSRLRSQGEIRASLLATQKQTACFIRTFSVDDNILCSYSKLYEKNKVQRLLFYFKNQISKSDWRRNLGLLLWG